MPLDNEHGKTIGRLTARDRAYFKLLERHHVLDTGQLYVGTQEHAGNYTAHQQRLQRLVNAGYLRIVEIPSYRNKDVPSSRTSLSLMHIYENTELAKEYLLDDRNRYARGKGDPYLHRYATASHSFSFEFGCRKRPGLDYISFEDHLRDTRCPEERRTSKANPLMIETASGKIEPDELFGVRYVEEAKAIFITWEQDRRTETVNPSVYKDSTIAQKVQGYVDIIRKRTYRTHWGIPNLLVHFATISEAHKDQIKAFIATAVPDPKIRRSFSVSFNRRFVPKYWTTTPVGYAAKTPPGKKHFYIPKEVFVEDMLATPLETIDGTHDLTFPH